MHHDITFRSLDFIKIHLLFFRLRYRLLMIHSAKHGIYVSINGVKKGVVADGTCLSMKVQCRDAFSLNSRVVVQGCEHFVVQLTGGEAARTRFTGSALYASLRTT